MSKIKSIAEENSEKILDIIIFGSSVRGKEKPGDLDVLVIYKTEVSLELNHKIKKEFEALGLEIDLTPKKYSELFGSGFIAKEAYLSEGYSIINDTFISEGLGFKPMVLFRYDIHNLNNSQRMRFYYSLYGRTTEGMLNKLKLKKFSERIIISPLEESEKVKEYLNSWSMNYLEIPVLIPARIVESEDFITT